VRALWRGDDSALCYEVCALHRYTHPARVDVCGCVLVAMRVRHILCACACGFQMGVNFYTQTKTITSMWQEEALPEGVRTSMPILGNK
jgi:hypothetical protein